MPTLRYEIDGKVLDFELKEASTTIGRDRGNGLQIKDKSMSRTHCRIDRTETGWKVVDLASRNGTFVNGEKFLEKELKPGDVVKIGNIPVTFEPAAAPVAVEPPKAVVKVPEKPAEAPKPPPPPLIEADEAVPTLEAIPEEVQASEASATPAPAPPKAEEPAPKPKTLRRAEPEPRARPARSGRKAPLIAVCLGVGMLAVGVVLFVVYRKVEAATNHAREVRARLREAVNEINRLSASDSIARDAMTEKLLSDTEYHQVAPEVMKQLAVEHEKLHAAAEADRKAATFVEPFFAKVDKAKQSRETWASMAQELFDESRELLRQYGSGGYADRLLGVSNDLKAFLEKKK